MAAELKVRCVIGEDDLLAVVLLGALVLEIGATGIEAEHLAVGRYITLVDPHVVHHRADPATDIFALGRIVAEGEHGGGSPAARHLAIAFGNEPDAMQRAHDLRPLLVSGHFGCRDIPYAHQPLEEAVLLQRFCSFHHPSPLAMFADFSDGIASFERPRIRRGA
ncbi:hypothetical protein AJ87_22575 [Rhizobium yanglingense]|nr:hypothetical protein AJ87_22575 [Rhizobium yanglingense]